MEQAVIGACEDRALGHAESAALKAITPPDRLHYVMTTVIAYAHHTILPDPRYLSGPVAVRIPRRAVSVGRRWIEYEMFSAGVMR